MTTLNTAFTDGTPMSALLKRIQTGAGMLATVGILLGGTTAHAQSATRFTEKGGEAIFKGICQGCHMPEGEGASGAGRYPALARDIKLAGRGYPLVIVVNGRRAMPAFGDFLSDRQIADVVNYVRSHFGNHYTDEVTMSEVKAVRPQSTPAMNPTLHRSTSRRSAGRTEE